MGYNRSLNDFREKGNKQGIIKKAVFRRFSPPGICQKANLLKSKKADSQRQQNITEQKVCMKYRVYILYKKVIILKIEQNCKIACNSSNKKQVFFPFAASIFSVCRFFTCCLCKKHFPIDPGPACKHCPINCIVDADAHKKNCKIGQTEISIEPEGEGCQPQLCRHAFLFSCQDIVSRQADRKKQKKKNVRIKLHGRYSF